MIELAMVVWVWLKTSNRVASETQSVSAHLHVRLQVLPLPTHECSWTSSCLESGVDCETIRFRLDIEKLATMSFGLPICHIPSVDACQIAETNYIIFVSQTRGI